MIQNHPKAWKEVELHELVDLLGGGTPSRKTPEFFTGSIPWLTGYDLPEDTVTDVFEGREKITQEAINKSSTSLVPKNTVLLTTRVTVGKVAIATSPLCFSQDVTGLIVKDSSSLHPRFLAYFLLSNRANLLRLNQGTTIEGVTRKDVAKVRIPLPPLAEQERIVCLLDEADVLRKLRAEATTRMEDFIPALFHEMFGDPTKNTKNWQVLPFGEICESRLGKMLDEKQQSGLHLRPYLRNQNVQWGYIDISNIAQMDFDEKDRETFRLQEGDLLICEGGEVGRTAIWHNELPECYFQKAIHRARPNREIALPEFILWTMYALSQSSGFNDFTSQSTIAHLTGVKLKTLPIPLPSLPLQFEFGRRVQGSREIQSRQARSAERIEALYQSMLSRAFAGEL